MNRKLSALFRLITRSLWLSGEIVRALMNFATLTIATCGIPDHAARARWLQRTCQRVLRVLHVALSVSGPVPRKGLLVCNHLSYLDILVLSATTPCTFVSKCEVKRWPVFGWFASLAGTLFVRRDKRSDVLRAAHEMRQAIAKGGLVVLFPEGTTSDGHQVLPFKTSLLHAAQLHPCVLSAASIDYALANGDVTEEVCYWKDMTLLPHLLNLFIKHCLTVEIRFAEVHPQNADRKYLARQLHSEVVRLKALSSALPMCPRARARPRPRFPIGRSSVEHQNESVIEASV
jgi:1-acyl-sn-glycerol-3-phosphate acyltransferase